MAFVAEHDVFIMHSPADREWVEAYLARALEDAGVVFTLQSRLEPGLPSTIALDDAVGSSRRQVLVVSESTVGDYLNDLLAAMTAQREMESGTWSLIPLVRDADAFDELRPLVRMRNPIWVDVDGEAWLRGFIDMFDRQLPEPHPQPKHDYVGLKPFRADDSHVFFGRDADVEYLCRRVAQRSLVVVTGASGTGKSSLISAGIIPNIQRFDGHRPARKWTSCTMVPGADPIADLLAALDSDRIASSVAGAVEVALSGSADEVLVFVDQAETVLATEHHENFFHALRELAALEHVHVVLAIRDEFRDDMSATSIGRLARGGEYVLQPLDADGLRAAITGPARRAKVTVAATLVERLVADAAGEPGILPFVQETMIALWSSVRRGYLPYEAYERLQAASADDGEVAGLYAALSIHADDVRGRLGVSDDELARILIRLVQFGEDRPNVRRAQTLAQLVAGPPRRAASVVAVVDELAGSESRLLTRAGRRSRTGAPSGLVGLDNVSVDLAHDSLLTHWLFLQRVAGDPARVRAERLRREAERDSARAAADGRSYLWEGRRLREASRWARSHDFDVSPAVAGFFRRSWRWFLGKRIVTLCLLVVVALVAAVAVRGWLEERTARQQAAGQAGMLVPVGGVVIERFEVSNGRYAACVRYGPCDEPGRGATGFTYDDPARTDLPVVNVSAYDAAEFCGWIRRRLPRWREWAHVATGGGTRPWPWSGTAHPTPARVNVFFVTPLADSSDDLPRAIRRAIGDVVRQQRITVDRLMDAAPWLTGNMVDEFVDDWPLMGVTERRERLKQLYLLGDGDKSDEELDVIAVDGLPAGATPDDPPIHHLQGNAGEWTATVAGCTGDDACAWNETDNVALLTTSSVAGDAEALFEPLGAVAGGAVDTRGFRCAARQGG